MSSRILKVVRKDGFRAVIWDETADTLELLRRLNMPWSGHSGHLEEPNLVRNMRLRVGGPAGPSRLASKGDYLVVNVYNVWEILTPDEFRDQFREEA